ncbi:hypothetical protein M758_UG291600 [Ceratodon purpureus]|nr:hypothetical protein M758_UG291600 [Ceratodon purpureus]
MKAYSELEKHKADGIDAPLPGGYAPSQHVQPSSQGPMGVPYYFQGGHPWPNWTQVDFGSTSAYSTANFNIAGGVRHSNSGDHAIQATSSAGRSGDLATNNGGFELKKTAQRRQQRLAKKNFHLNSKEWPIKVSTDGKGEIHESCRLHVHKIIRSAASSFLKLDVIKFRDHPDEMVNKVKEVLDKMLIFDDDIRNDYMLWYVETAMRKLRYMFHKHWIATGRGEKHPGCPGNCFPALVSQWHAIEAEEEAKKTLVESTRIEVANKTASSSGKTPSTPTSGSWNLLEEEDPDFINWDDSDIFVEEALLDEPSPGNTNSDRVHQKGNTKTPTSNDTIPSTQEDPGTPKHNLLPVQSRHASNTIQRSIGL